VEEPPSLPAHPAVPTTSPAAATAAATEIRDRRHPPRQTSRDVAAGATVSRDVSRNE
jgi:hypothetical protein